MRKQYLKLETFVISFLISLYLKKKKHNVVHTSLTNLNSFLFLISHFSFSFFNFLLLHTQFAINYCM